MLRLTRPARLLAVAAVPVGLNRELPRDSLPIYPTESPKPEIVEAPTQLEAAIRQSREKVTETYRVGRVHLQFVVDRWIGVEHAVEFRLKSLAPPPDVEPLFPGALWVGIAALSGSILAPKRSILRRTIYPPAWGFLAAIYFLPLTTSNVGKYIAELEDRYIPSVAKRQKDLATQLRARLADGKERTKRLEGDFTGQVDKLIDMLRERTGLKIGEKEDDKITDLERLVHDTTRLWCVSELWLCIILSIGCVVGFLPNSKFRTRCIQTLVHLMLFLFVHDAFSCYSTYTILQSRGFAVIGKVCQANKPTDLSETPFFEEFCRDIEITSKYVALAALVVWKLVGLNMIVLTWVWYKRAAKGQEATEKEVPEGAGLVKLTGEETQNVELKV